jgi:hypothetical protein
MEGDWLPIIFGGEEKIQQQPGDSLRLSGDGPVLAVKVYEEVSIAP